MTRNQGKDRLLSMQHIASNFVTSNSTYSLTTLFQFIISHSATHMPNKTVKY